jgi:hypothetical protein
MHSRTKVVLPSLAGLGLVGLLVAGVISRSEKPGPPQSQGTIPKDRESLLVMEWMIHNHPDAAHLHFVTWWPPMAVTDNPFTHEPCTLVRVMLKNSARGQDPPEVEASSYYLKGDQVLGALPHPAGFSEPPPVKPSTAQALAPAEPPGPNLEQRRRVR